MILKNIKLKNKLKELIKNYPEIIDVFLFGSTIRGKEKPTDFDILLLFKNKINKEIEYDVRKELEKYYKNVSIISKIEKTLFEASFDAREGFLFEGISLITEKNVAENYGFSSFGMFKYDFSNWNKLQKTKFYYALNGRNDKEGIIQILNSIKLSDSLILVPLENIEKFREFIDFWKIKSLYIPILIPKRLGRQKILE